MQELQKRLGQCYNLAGRYIHDHPKALLVHGTFNGIRFNGIDFNNPHAWIEEDGEVYDPVMDCQFPLQDYYNLFQAVANKKYTHQEACEKMLETEHFGPWNET